MKSDHWILRMENVSVAYDNSGVILSVLKDINLEIYQGEWIGIAGKNGSGKSTLSKIISGVCPLSRGHFILEKNQTVQMVFQNSDAQIIGETVQEEICFGMEIQMMSPSLISTRIRQVLLDVGLHVPLDRYISDMSGGQKQLLNIASCLAVEATILVFDEATAMLDPMARKRVLEIVRGLHKNGMTIIWITQWMEELAFADRILALDEGNLVFNGKSHSFFYQEVGTDDVSVCEQLGFALPYVVQVSKQLLADGYMLNPLPVSVGDLNQAVKTLCQSS